MCKKYNLHLFSNEKFVSGAVLQFEEYYPQQNIYVVNAPSEMEYPLDPGLKKNICFLDLEKKESFAAIRDLVEENAIRNIFIHHLDYLKAGILLRLKNKRKFRTYWIFYGSDFYTQIASWYNFFDESPPPNEKKQPSFGKRIYSVRYWLRYKTTGRNAVRRAIEEMDYFCFWNPYELVNVKKYYRTKAVFRQFIYTSAIYHNGETTKSPASGNKNIMLVNHAASRWANHVTILKKITALQEYSLIDEIILPLSYGPESIRQKVIGYCTTENIRKARYLTAFLPPEMYFQQLDTVSVAFFGAKRQEGAGNIFYLLRTGAKIFLRAENPMLPFLKECGFTVFCFEKDTDRNGSVLPLPEREAKHNLQIYRHIFNQKSIADFMSDLLQ